jgi:acetoacetyl-CoA reductase
MKNKIALVTGGIRGIGDAISTKLLKEGAFVIAVATNEQRNNKWVEAKKQAGFDNVAAYACNVADYDACQRMIADIKEKYKKIDILINNAGVTRDSAFKKMDKESWDTVIGINLNSVFNITRPVINMMLDNGYGRIINMSSVNGQKGQFGQTNYAAAKAGMHGFTKSLARETARKNITVNTVSPGYIATEMVMQIPEDIRQKIIAQIPVGRLGQPEEIADLITFLAKESSGYMTGADFSINGGLHIN